MSMVESQPAYSDVRLLVVMGSSGCGKSTVGSALAHCLVPETVENFLLFCKNFSVQRFPLLRAADSYKIPVTLHSVLSDPN